MLDALALVGCDRLHEALTAAQQTGASFPARFAAFGRAYFDFAHTALLELMYTVKHAPEASEAVLTAGGTFSPADTESGPDDAIAFVLRGCA